MSRYAPGLFGFECLTRRAVVDRGQTFRVGIAQVKDLCSDFDSWIADFAGRVEVVDV